MLGAVAAAALAACAEDEIAVGDGDSADVSQTHDFAGSGTLIPLNVNGDKTIDLAVTSAGRRMVIELSRGDQLIARKGATGEVFIHGLTLRSGSYELTVVDLSKPTRPGQFSFAITKAARALPRTEAPGYLVGKPAPTEKAALARWDEMCTTWSETVFGFFGPTSASDPAWIDFADCGEPALATDPAAGAVSCGKPQPFEQALPPGSFSFSGPLRAFVVD